MRVLAIDPGAVSGAYAYFDDDGPPVVGDLPVVDGQLDGAFLGQMVRGMDPQAAVVERVASMPKQGVASTFKFGMAVGIVHGVLMSNSVPLHLVSPSVWKRHFHLLNTDKDAARAFAIRLYPAVQGLHLKKHHGRADALLIGDWFLYRERRS